jgi:hypothetical protein
MSEEEKTKNNDNEKKKDQDEFLFEGRAKSKSTLRRLFEKKPSQFKELFSNPSISFDLLKINRYLY